ncbi:MAG: right-handed parallel beta-helix repeat-containing protein [Fimbriimonadaceae bacterium]
MLSFVLMGVVSGAAVPEIALTPGLVIKESCKIKAGDYLIPGGDQNKPAITIQGKGITVDFRDATLRGSKAEVEPDQRSGFGIVVKGQNIRLRGATVRGYKVGLFADGADGLKIEESNFSYNWKQHLKSGRLKEDLGDWMSYHQNEKDEWFEYGAGIYLKGLKDFEVRGTVITGGQNGLMMTRCVGGLVWNNDFSFLSSLGIGMYRSSNNRIMHNNIDWCVRGYSHRFYNRGQDSAGILMYEQSSDNTIAYNSVTHGGDGLFLWAGQSTMDNGQGGCNDNLFYGNDFSHAPTNGIETTFSRNRFVNNLVLECWHGVWGGYSFDSEFIGNVFGLNGEAMAIEHGQNNKILINGFIRDTVGIRLWANERQDPNWGYPKNRDTKSHGYVIANNLMERIGEFAFSLTRTENVSMTENDVSGFGKAFDMGVGNLGLRDTGSEYALSDPVALPSEIKQEKVNVQGLPGEKLAPYMARSGLVNRKGGEEQTFKDTLRTISWNPLVSSNDLIRASYVQPLDGGSIPFLGMNARRGRTEILVDQWGPVDFRSPVLWLEDWYDTPDGQKYYVFRMFGPTKGGWNLKSVEGCVYTKMDPAWKGVIPGTPPFVGPEVSKLTGDMGDRILVKAKGQFKIGFEYSGVATTDYRGVVTPAGKPVLFGYVDDSVNVKWNLSFFNYDFDKIDPREKPTEFREIYETTPVATQRTESLDGSWSGSPAPGVNANHFATLAEGRVTVEQGDYTLSVTSDDGVRVLIDDKVVFEDWTWHGPKSDDIKLKLGGKHSIRIEHFELDGFSALQVRLTKN